MNSKKSNQKMWEYFSNYLTQERREKLLRVAASRTHYLRVVLQDIHNPHNVSACMRSAEAFGLQNVDVVTHSQSSFKTSTVAKGVGDWLSVNSYSDVDLCARSLKNSGYQIFAAEPHNSGCALEELDVSKPLALVFGNEHKGIDPKWASHVSGFFTIPMVGFVESLNISVSAAISMYKVSELCLARMDPVSYYVSEGQKQSILLEWLEKKSPSWFSQTK